MKKHRILSRLTAIVLAAGVTFSLAACGGKENTITIGSKDFSENTVTAEMLAQLVEHDTDLKVNRKLNMGGTFICFEALKNGQLDVYPEYTGTALKSHLKMDTISDAEESYRVVSEEFIKQFGIQWLEPLGFNNTYTLSVSNDVYEKYGVETYSDLAKISPELTIGGDHEFFDRVDGFDGLVDLYGLAFKGEPKKMNVSLKYQAIGSGDIDVTDAYATDAPIKQYNLKVLKDDKNFFPPYYAAPIVRQEVLQAHPELETTLNKLAGLISDETMTDLNYRIDVEGEDVAKVATDFLTQNGLLD